MSPRAWGACAPALLLGLALAACEGPAQPYTKSGANPAQTERDVADCRSRVNAFLAKDRGIDADRQATVGATGGGPGPVATRRQLEAGSDERRNGRLMRDCMQAKGYSGGDPDRGGIRW